MEQVEKGLVTRARAVGSIVLYLISLALLIPPVSSASEDRPEYLPQGAIAIATFIVASAMDRKPSDSLIMIIGRCTIFAVFSWVIFRRIMMGP